MYTRLLTSRSFQIIHKIKKPGESDAREKVEDVCDRIFELVDKNKDCELRFCAFIIGAPRWCPLVVPDGDLKKMLFESRAWHHSSF